MDSHGPNQLWRSSCQVIHEDLALFLINPVIMTPLFFCSLETQAAPNIFITITAAAAAEAAWPRHRSQEHTDSFLFYPKRRLEWFNEKHMTVQSWLR